MLRKIVCLLMLCACAIPNAFATENDSRTFEEISIEILTDLSKIREEVDKLPDDYAEFVKAQEEMIESLKNLGEGRVLTLDLATYEANKAHYDSRIGIDCDSIAISIPEGHGQRFFSSVQGRQGYSSVYDACGNVMVSSHCIPQSYYQQNSYNCCPQPSHHCEGGACPGAGQFQQYNRGRPIGQRVFGPGYNGRTLQSTMQEAPLLRPYLFTHAFNRLENPTRIGQGRALNFLFPRIRYKNGHICSEHDMKVHLGRRQWAIIIASSAAGGGGAAGLIPIVP